MSEDGNEAYFPAKQALLTSVIGRHLEQLQKVDKSIFRCCLVHDKCYDDIVRSKVCPFEKGVYALPYSTKPNHPAECGKSKRMTYVILCITVKTSLLCSLVVLFASAFAFLKVNVQLYCFLFESVFVFQFLFFL